MQAHFQCAGKASDTVRSQLGKRPGDLIYNSGFMPEGRVQIHPGFAQSVPSAFLTHLPLKIQGRVSIRTAMKLHFTFTFYAYLEDEFIPTLIRVSPNSGFGILAGLSLFSG